MPASEFSDVFISYRRLDVEFVKRLVEDLQNDGKEIWIDWEDIPPGVEGFADEIKRGIEGADAFIAVLTPDYLTSPYCVDMELQYAIDLQKKIIPLVLRDFDGHSIPKGISHINWIYFIPHAGQSNAYEESFPKILDVMHTDLEHVRHHKRFLLRAIEWHENNREQSFLLNGEEIENAQGWLTHSAGKEPIPNDLHREYITASVKLRQRQQRLLLSGVTGALVVSVILAILSLIGFNDASVAQATAVANLNIASTAQAEAEANEALASTARANAETSADLAQTAQAEAETNEAIAHSAQLEAEQNLQDARQSQALFHGDLSQQQANRGLYQRALLLALEALKFHQEGIISDSAYNAIHSALHQPVRQTFHINYPTGILEAIWHENREQILIATEEDNPLTCRENVDCTVRVEIWDFIEQERESYLPHEFAITNVLWNQTDEQVLTLSYDDVSNQSRIMLWDAEEQTELYRVDSEKYIEWIDWEVGSNYFVAGQQEQFSCGFGDQPSCNHIAVVFDYVTGERVAEYPQSNEVINVEFSPDSLYVEVTVRQGFNRFKIIYDFATGESIGFYDQALGAMLWREDDDRALVSTGEAIVAQPLQSMDILYSISTTQPFRVIEDLIFINQPDDCDDVCRDLQVFDAITGEERLTTDHITADAILFSAVLQDGRYLLTQTNDRSDVCTICESALYLWSLETGDLLHTFNYDGWIENGIGGVDLNSDETKLVTHAINTIEHNIVEVWDIATGELLLRNDLDRGVVNDIRFDDSDQHLIVTYLDEVGIYDVISGNLQHTVNFSTPIQEVIVLHDDYMLATRTNTVFNTWRVVDWQPTLDNPVGYTITGENYNADKSQLVTWSGSSRFAIPIPNAYVWDVETGKLLLTLETESPVNYAEWSPDRKHIAVLQWAQNCDADCVSSTLIFDAVTGERIANYDEWGGAGTLMWYPDSSHIMRMFDFMTIFDMVSGDVIFTSDTLLPGDNQWNSDYSAFVYQNFADQSMQVYDYPSGDIVQTLPTTTQAYGTQWVNQDEILVFMVDSSSGRTTRVVAYDVASGEELYTIDNVGIFESSHDGSRLAIYTEDRRLHGIDAVTGEILWTNSVTDEQWTELLWSPNDDMVIISGFFALQSHMFETETGERVKTFPYSEMSWSPDGRLLLAYDDNANPPIWRVYDTEADRVRFSFQPSSTPQWGADSRTIVSHEGRWSVEFGELVRRGLQEQIRDLTERELQEFFIKPPPDDPVELSQQSTDTDEVIDDDDDD